MKLYKTYTQHNRRWNKDRDLVKKYNDELIRQWGSTPWWKFWVKKPSFEEQRRIILGNWSRFNRLPMPLLEDYFPMKWNKNDFLR